jgi:hypothetical protein
LPTNPKFDLKFIYYGVLGILAPNLVYTKDEKDNPNLFNIIRFIKLIFSAAYFHLQATKPDTIGHAFTDSPVGLLAYILEKYSLASFGTNGEILGFKDGMLDNFSKDELLTIVTYYWTTNSFTSSMRFYKNQMITALSSVQPKAQLAYAKVPEQVAVSIHYFKNEILILPYYLLKNKYPNLISYKLETFGGHFAAFENPVSTAKNFIEFINIA